jgi:hypothetical protein
MFLRTLHPLVHDGTLLFDYTRPDGLRVIARQISLEALKSTPKGFGGRVGILPQMPDGSYLVNLSNRGLFSDFGGGVKAREYHYESLQRELQEEAPQWKDVLLEKLPEAQIYCLEEFYPRDYRKSKRTIRVMILCIVPFEDDSGFVPSEEVLQIKRVHDLENFLRSHPLNLGLQQLLRCRYLTQ